jgi:hypothetical protein
MDKQYGDLVCARRVTRVVPLSSGVPRGGWGVQPPKFRIFDKAELNSQFRGKHIRSSLTIIIRVSVICKLSGTPD